MAAKKMFFIAIHAALHLTAHLDASCFIAKPGPIV